MIRFELPDDSPPYLIAEIGKNFIQTEERQSTDTYLENARALVDAAADAGADAVKFQTHNVDDEQADLQIISPHFTGSDRYSWVKRNTEVTPLEEFWQPLVEHCRSRDITFFTTPMSRGAAQKAEKLNPPFWKVGSGDVKDHLLLRYLLQQQKPIILSTGMVSHAELDATVQYMAGYGHAPLILYCVSKYPAPKEYFNLALIDVFKAKYPASLIGFSDHSIGHEVAFAAAKLGARVIEKHFSFSRELWGSDHKVSMTPEEFRILADGIRSGSYKDVETAPWYGSRDRELEGAKNEFRPYFDKTLVASRTLKAGEALSMDRLLALRPKMHLFGFGAEELEAIEGRVLSTDVAAREPITEAMLQPYTFSNEII